MERKKLENQIAMRKRKIKECASDSLMRELKSESAFRLTEAISESNKQKKREA